MSVLIQRLESVLGTRPAPSPRERELFGKAQDFARFIGWIPGLRMIAVSNSLAMHATHADSDIDLFIITAPRRIWIVRTLVLLAAEILRVRTKPGDEAGKFCFPFFITEKSLSLKGIALENDVYLAYWIHTLKPLCNRSYVYGRFMEVNRTFCETTLGYTFTEEEWDSLVRTNRAYLLRTQENRIRSKVAPFLDPLLSLLDNALGLLSQKLIAKKTPSE